MARTYFGSARIQAAMAGVLALASLAACSDGNATVTRRHQAAASLPGYACAPSPAALGETICTRRGTAIGADPNGPAARFGPLSRSAALASYPRNAPAARRRALPLTGRFGAILPGLDFAGVRAADSQPELPGLNRAAPPSHAAPAAHFRPAHRFESQQACEEQLARRIARGPGSAGLTYRQEDGATVGHRSVRYGPEARFLVEELRCADGALLERAADQ